MSNTIELAKSFVPKLDECYRLASLTSVLDGAPELAKQGANANELIIPMMSMDGLADYSRNGGYVQGGVTMTNETVKCNFDRGRRFDVDVMDDLETAGLAFGRLSAQFIRDKVVPELDAFRFASYCGISGVTKKEETLADGAATVAALSAAVTAMDDEEVTATGSEYVAKLTDRAISYYAEVERRFTEMNGVLDDAATAEAADTGDNLWSTNGDLYTANGISKTSLQTYLLNAQKAKALLKMTYGPDGTTPVAEDEYTDFVNNDCYYIEAVQFPLVDYSTYSMADDDQKAAIMATAESCMAELNTTATAETASNSALYTAAMTYVPQAMAAMGSSLDASQAVYYAASQLYTPDDLSSYGSDEYNNLTDPLDEAGLNHWTTINLGTTILVARKIDPFKTYTVDELNSMYDLLSSMKSTDIQSELYAAGAALEHNLNSSALNTYSASKIKKNV